MIKKLYLIMLCLFLFHTAEVHAQCTNGRYNSYIFPSVTRTTVTYSPVYSLAMDIYQPDGDTATKRPIIILAHGGSFIFGSRSDDNTVDSLCARFARRGYVTVSIDYRLNPAILSSDSIAIDEVVKAISDGKAAIRYFVKDAATSNIYKIDTNNIFIGGNSAGAVLYMHVGYVTDSLEYPAYLDTAIAHNGGFEGNSGNAGYTTKSKAIINLAGALNMTAFVNTGDEPSVNVQGDMDNTVPYNCGNPVLSSITIHVQLCGLGALEPVYVAKGISHMSKVYPGDGHVPWSTDPAKFNTVDSLVRVFLFSMVCPGVNEVAHIAAGGEASVFPNPCSGSVNITAPAAIKEVTIVDQAGRVMLTMPGANKQNGEINVSSVPPGIYFVKIKFADGSQAPEVRKIAIR